MITLLLHVFRLLPILCGGHRHLVLENLALRHQLAVYKRTVALSLAKNPASGQVVCPPPRAQPVPARLLLPGRGYGSQRLRDLLARLGLRDPSPARDPSRSPPRSPEFP